LSFLRIGQYDGGDHEDAAQAFLKADAVVVEPDGQEEAEDGFHGNNERGVGVARVLLGDVLGREGEDRIEQDEVSDADQGVFAGADQCVGQAGKGQGQQPRRQELKEGHGKHVSPLDEVADIYDLNREADGRHEGQDVAQGRRQISRLQAQQGQAGYGQQGAADVAAAQGIVSQGDGQKGDENGVGRDEEGMALYCRQGQAVELEDESDELNGADNDAVSYFAPRAAEYLLMEEQEHDGGGQEEAGAHDAEGRQGGQGFFRCDKAAAPDDGDEEKGKVCGEHFKPRRTGQVHENTSVLMWLKTRRWRLD
jgi:hypothetical protein